MPDHEPEPHIPPPGTIPAIPKYNTVERLVVALEEAGVLDRVARAIASSVTDPAAFRRALQDPTTIHTPNGELVGIYARVWTLAVIPHPTNVRLSPLRRRATSGESRLGLSRAVSNPDGATELIITADDRDTVVGAVTKAINQVAAANPLAGDVGLDGIIEPITVVPVTFYTDDGEDDATVLSAVDGSSRVAGAYQNLHVNPERVLFEYTADRSAMRGRLGRWVRLAETNSENLDDDDIRQLNSVTAPAFVVIGFNPPPARRFPPTFAQAVEARVGAIHVAPPTPWSRSAQLDAQLDAVLDALHSEGLLGNDDKDFLAGDVTPDEAKAALQPIEQDARAALLLAELHRPGNVTFIHDALRSVAIRRPTYKQRAALAAEGALRGFRHDIAEGQADAARNLLTHVFEMPEFRGSSWTLSTDDPDELLNGALDGSADAARELLALAIYWMARLAIVRRTTRGGEKDRTDIATVLRQLLSDERGLHQLHRIVVDGRANRAPRRVSTSGTAFVRKRGTDAPLLVDEKFIRSAWSPGWRGEDEPSAAPSVLRTPEAALHDAMNALSGQVDVVVEHVRALAEPKGPDGRPLVETLGLVPSGVDEVLGKWNKDVVGPLSMYAHIARGSG